MPAVVALHESPARRDQLGGIIADYLALERARYRRRALVAAFGFLAILMLGLGVAVHHNAAAWVGVSVSLIAPAWAWTIELRCDWRLAKRLDEVPQG